MKRFNHISNHINKIFLGKAHCSSLVNCKYDFVSWQTALIQYMGAPLTSDIGLTVIMLTRTACMQVCLFLVSSPHRLPQTTQAKLQPPTNTETHGRCLSASRSNAGPALAQHRGDGADLLHACFSIMDTFLWADNNPGNCK